MNVTQISLEGKLPENRSLHDLSKEDRQQLCHLVREVAENANKLKVDFEPAVSCIATCAIAFGGAMLVTIVGGWLLGQAGLVAGACLAVSAAANDPKSMFNYAKRDAIDFYSQHASPQFLEAIQNAQKLRSNLQVFSEKTKLDLSSVISEFDSQVLESAGVKKADQKSILKNKDLLSQFFAGEADLLDVIKNTENTISKVTRKVLK